MNHIYNTMDVVMWLDDVRLGTHIFGTVFTCEKFQTELTHVAVF